MEKLFSYGTLQLPNVQLASFGRLLTGTKTSLRGYTLDHVAIKDPHVLALSHKEYHPVATPSANSTVFIEGVIFEVTSEELVQSDKYEVDDYKRVAARFENGETAWIYIAS